MEVVLVVNDRSGSALDELPAALDGVDLTDQARFAAGFPHEVFARLRAEAPVLRHPAGRSKDGEGFWVLSRYEDVRAAAADPRLSSQGGGGRAGGGTHIDDLKAGVHAGVLINMLDDPRHALLRTLVTPPVTAEAVRSREPALRVEVGTLLDLALAAGGPVDLQREVCAPYAIRTVAAVLGAPPADWPQLTEWGLAVTGLDDRESGQVDERAAQTVYAVYEYSQRLVEAKRAALPADDLMSVLSLGDLPAGSGEPPLSDYERHAFFVLLMAAGSEPPRNAMAGGLLALARHPEQWAALRADRSLLPGAVEEILRWTSPTPYNRRTVTEPMELGGSTVGPGEKVTLWWASANRDAAVFADPDVFDIRRAPNPHLGFGSGLHACLGAALARAELRLLLDELLDRVAELRLAGPVRWAPSNKHTVTLELPVELVPAPTGKGGRA